MSCMQKLVPRLGSLSPPICVLRQAPLVRPPASTELRVMVQCAHNCAVRAHATVTTGFAYEARKAPGGAYMHNIFHQAEHLLCFFRQALELNETPDTILWPYRTMAWSQEFARAVLPSATWIETCCGPVNVKASWYQGRRKLCGCFQRVCPLRFESFWPTGGSAAQTIRELARRVCGLPGSNSRLRQPIMVRLLERASRDGRQLEARPALLAAIESASGAKPELMTAEIRSPASGGSHRNFSTLCEQVRWFANADVIVVAHGAATTNAIFADAGALVIDIAPFAYHHEPSAPSEYYATLLNGTDIQYRLLHTARPHAALVGASAARIEHATTLDADRCRNDKTCRIAYRDHCCMRLEDAQLKTLQRLIRRARAAGDRSVEFDA